MAGHNGRGYWKNMAPGVSIRDLDLEQRDGEAERFGCKMGSQGLTIRVSPPKMAIGGVSVNVSQAHFVVLVFRGCDAGFQNGWKKKYFTYPTKISKVWK